MRGCLLVCSLLLVACPKAPPPAPPPPRPLEPDEAVKALFQKLYEGLERGDADRLEGLFTDDALVFGLGPADTWAGGANVITHVRQQLLPIGLSGDALEVESTRVVVGLGPGNDSAWAFDLPKVHTTHHDDTSTWLPRVTAHLVREGERWRLDALHVSLAVPDAMVSAPDASRKLLAPADVPADRSPDADELVGLVRRSLDDYAVKVERTSESESFVQLGTSAPEVFVGGQKFKALLVPQLGAIKKAGYAFRLDGNLRVSLSPGGRSGWAAAVVVQKVGVGKKVQTYPPFRFLWTLEKEGEFWNITSEHQSLAVKEELREPASKEELETWKQVRAQLPEKLKAKPAPGDAGTPAPADAGPAMEAW